MNQLLLGIIIGTLGIFLFLFFFEKLLCFLSKYEHLHGEK